MQARGLLIVVSGPSGAGKGTICKELLRNHQDVGISVSVTTRQPREGEVHGVNYFFKTREAFQRMIEQDELLEYAEVYGNYYGTPKQFVVDQIGKGQDILLEIDIQGAMQIRSKYREGIFVFIVPPSMAELKNRIIKRGSETADTLETRFSSAFEEIEHISKYDYFIINDTVSAAVTQLHCIIQAEKCRVIDGSIDELIQEFKEGLHHA